MQVLLTGAAGLIGKHAIRFLRNAGHEVYAISRSVHTCDGVRWRQADLLDFGGLKDIFAEAKPDLLLHLAWDTRPGKYLEDNANFTWLATSLEMLRLFHLHGGRRAVMAGTCFEYECAEKPFVELAPLAPISTYAKCKNSLNQLAALFCAKNGISYGWGRIFYVYGPGEQTGRLTPELITKLTQGEEMTVKGGPLRRDYMYAKDIAAAFVKFLLSPVEGQVNIASGEAVKLSDYCRRLAVRLGQEERLVFKDDVAGQPSLIVGDVRRLREEVGFTPRYDLEDGFADMLSEMAICARKEW